MPKIPMRVACLVLAVAIAAPGCASRRRAALPTEPAVIGTISVEQLASTSQGPLRITIGKVIVPNAAGSWMPNAPWDEYHLVLANDSDDALVVEAIELAGVAATGDATGTTTRLRAGGAAGQVGAGVGAVATTAGAVAAVPVLSAAGAVLSVAGTTTVVGVLGSALTVASVVAVPLAVVGGVAMVVSATRRAEKRQEAARLVEEHFADAFKAPLEIAARASSPAKVFFPVGAKRSMLAARYRIGEETRIATVEFQLAKPR